MWSPLYWGSGSPHPLGGWFLNATRVQFPAGPLGSCVGLHGRVTVALATPSQAQAVPVSGHRPLLPHLPTGPAESLFKESYYQLMKTALKEEGILCCQGEGPPLGGGSGEGPAGADNAAASCPIPRRVPVAAPRPHQGDAAVLQVALPRGGLCLLHHPHLPQRPDRLHALQQKPSEHWAVPGVGAGGHGEPSPETSPPVPRAPTFGSPCSC